MRSIIIAFVLVLTSTNVFAEAIQKEVDVRAFTDSVMETLIKEGVSSAYNKMRPYILVPSDEFDASLLQSKAQREQLGPRYGNMVGYEFISSEKAGESLIKIQYIEKREKTPLLWIFFFYKTGAGWTINSFFWHDKVFVLFD